MKLTKQHAFDSLVVLVSLGFAVSGLLITAKLSTSLFTVLSTVLIILGGIVSVVAVLVLRTQSEESKVQQEKKIEAIEVKAEKEPEKTKFAWDLARVKLEAYFDRNLSQVRMIFFVAVLVMIVGFGFILWGVSHGIANPESLKPSYLAALSGIITEFIGVTFMVIYRSTMAQANQFMEVLERINTVGMAVQILDAIPEQETTLKNSTRAEIVSLLLSVNVRVKTASVKTREPKITTSRTPWFRPRRGPQTPKTTSLPLVSVH